MKSVPITILAISPELEQSAGDLHSNIIEKLREAGLQCLHVGAGVNTVYVILASDVDQLKLEEVTGSCNAAISGSGYLQLEKNELPEKEIESIEQAFMKNPINYDIPVVGTWGLMFGLCDDCGGVGRHNSNCKR